jgi:hypothetical protein
MIDAASISKAAKGLHVGEAVGIPAPKRVSVLTPISGSTATYLYVSRYGPEIDAQISRANGILSDYQDLLARSRAT